MSFSLRSLIAPAVVVAATLGIVQVGFADPPGADFTFVPTTPRPGQAVQFDSTLSDTDEGQDYTYAWTFGDGGTSTQADPSHTYSTPGSYQVSLIVSDSGLEVDPPVIKTVNVVNTPPTAAFSCSPTTVGQGQATTCNASASSDLESGLTYAWDADGDGFDDGTDQSEQFSYAQPGTKTITLRVTDSFGDTHTTNRQITVSNGTPTPVLTVTPNPARIDQTVTFSGSGSSDPGGSIESYQWDLDGNASNGFEVDTGSSPTTSRSYPTAGSRAIRLRVVDNDNGSAVDSETLFIFDNVPPTARLTASPNPAQIGENVAFSASTSTDSDGDIEKYEWDLDGNTGNGFEVDTDDTPTTSRFYTSAGFRTITVRTTDNDGGVDTSSLSLRVNAPPTARLSISPNPALIGETVEFDGSDSSDGDSTIVNYEWDLDGNTGNGFEVDTNADPTTSRSYPTAGIRTIRLRVTDSDGATHERTRELRVQVTRPNATYSFAPSAPLPGQPVTFTSRSTPSTSPGSPQIVSTEWDFNYNPNEDFSSDATGTTARTSFATAGPKNVAIKVTETGGGFAISSGTVVVNAPPQASFNIAPSSPLDGDTVTFASTSADPDGPLTAQDWDLDGDGQFGDAMGAVTARAYSPGPRVVRLRVTDSRGASAIAERRFTVVPRPLKLLEGVKITLFGNLTRKGARLKRLFVRTPAKATVRITCKGRACPQGTIKKRATKTRRLRFKKFERSFPARTVIVVTVTRRGYIGQYTRIKIRNRLRRYIRRDRCVLPSSAKPIACPDA